MVHEPVKKLQNVHIVGRTRHVTRDKRKDLLPGESGFCSDTGESAIIDK
jgi:hypothetical protein